MAFRCSLRVVIAAEVQFTPADFRQATTAIFSIARLACQEHHRFIFPVTANCLEAELFHVRRIESIPLQVPVFVEPLLVVNLSVNLPHLAVRPVFANGRNEMLSHQCAEMKLTIPRANKVPRMSKPFPVTPHVVLPPGVPRINFSPFQRIASPILLFRPMPAQRFQ